MSVGFYLYALLLAPDLARALKAGLADPQPILWPGLLILLLLILEPFALRGKALFVRRRAADDHRTPQGSMLGIFSLAVIGHFMVTIFLGLLMLDCWGKTGTGSETLSPWLAWVLVLLVLKEMVALFSMGGQAVSREPPGHPREWASDWILLAFSCVVYTVWWEALVDLEELSALDPGTRLALFPFLGLLFLLVYLPLRFPFLLEEHYLRPLRGRKMRLFLEMGIGVALGLYPLFM